MLSMQPSGCHDAVHGSEALFHRTTLYNLPFSLCVTAEVIQLFHEVWESIHLSVFAILDF